MREEKRRVILLKPCVCFIPLSPLPKTSFPSNSLFIFLSLETGDSFRKHSIKKAPEWAVAMETITRTDEGVNTNEVKSLKTNLHLLTNENPEFNSAVMR